MDEVGSGNNFRGKGSKFAQCRECVQVEGMYTSSNIALPTKLYVRSRVYSETMSTDAVLRRVVVHITREFNKTNDA